MWPVAISTVLLAISLNGGMEVEPSESYRAVLEPRQRSKIYAEVSVPVVKITKKLGESFEKGELLIQFQDEVFYRTYLKAIAEVAQMEAKLSATKQLYDDKISSDYELKTAEAELADSKANYAIASKKFHDTAIRAPFSGKVKNVNIREFELPIDDTELIEIVDDKVLIAKLLVSSQLLPFLKIGQPLLIQVQETGDFVETTITRIGAMIDPSSSTIKIEAEIDNADQRLKAGMVGYVTIEEKM